MPDNSGYDLTPPDLTAELTKKTDKKRAAAKKQAAGDNSEIAKDTAKDEAKNQAEAQWEKQHPGEVKSDDGTIWSTDPSKWTPQQTAEFQQGMGVLSTPGVTKGLVFEGQHGQQLADLPPGGVLGVGQGAPQQTGQTGQAGKPAATTTNSNAISPAAQAANQMMQSLAGEYTGEMASMAPYMSGSAGVQAGQSAQAMGSSLAGGGVQAQNPTYAAQLAGPQNTVAGAMAAGSKDIAQGISDLGTADQAYMQTAPYQGLLAALQSEGQYKIEPGAATPNVSTPPTWAQAAYADVLGAAPAGAGSTSTPGNTQSQLAAEQAATTPSTTSSQSPGQAGGSA